MVLRAPEDGFMAPPWHTTSRSIQSFRCPNSPRNFISGWDPASCLAIPSGRVSREFMPTFYSEVMGDYLCLFSYLRKDAAHNVQICGVELADRLAEAKFPAGS